MHSAHAEVLLDRPAPPDNLLSEWSRLIVGALALAGIRRVVVSPGSRSTPLVFATLARTELRHQVVVDERAAGFLAMAQGRYSGAPSALLCTSGSAPGHYLPAVIEADEARVPLVVLSADRPAHLQGCRSPQTIDQQQLFGGKVRHFVDLGATSEQPRKLRALLRQLLHAVALAQGPEPGPVHINVPMDLPLEPRQDDSSAGQRLTAMVDDLLSSPPLWTSAGQLQPIQDDRALEEVARLAQRAARPMCVAGPLGFASAQGLDAIVDLLARLQWPLYAETTSGLRMHPRCSELRHWDNFDHSLRSGVLGSALPDFVLQLGYPPSSRAVLKWLADPELPRVVLSSGGHADPHDCARVVLRGPLSHSAAALSVMAAAGKLPLTSSAYQRTVSQHAAEARAAHRQALAEEPWNEVAAIEELGVHLQPGDALLVGNSLPVRLVDLALPASDTPLHVVSQRGANGIDGLLAGAAGTASVHSGRVVVLLGDVSALHDVGSLAVLAQQRCNVLVVVLNNAGCRIFEQLPIGNELSRLNARGLGAAAAQAWFTPHEFSLSAIANSFGVSSVCAEDRRGLRQALADRAGALGPALVEVRLPPSGATRYYEISERCLRERFA